MTESQLQAKCYQWAHNTFPSLRGCIFSVPNGGTRNRIEATQLKATGLVPGIPDMLIVFPKFIGIEFKTETGVLSPAQARIHEIWQSKGLRVEVVRTFDAFHDLVTELMDPHDVLNWFG